MKHCWQEQHLCVRNGVREEESCKCGFPAPNLHSYVYFTQGKVEPSVHVYMDVLSCLCLFEVGWC